jgi:hypothetical protein
LTEEFSVATREQQTTSEDPRNQASPDWSALYRVGGFAAFALILYSLLTIVQMILLGGQPSSAAEAFRLLQTNKVVALLRLDLPTIAILPLYYLVFLGLYKALKGTSRTISLIGTALIFTGNTLVLSTPTALSLIPLSNKYVAATSDVARSQLLAAGEALMASDIWHSTGAILGGVLLQSGAVLISIAMLRGGVFGRFTAWLGIVMHALDLAHILVGVFLPSTGAILLAIAGPFYPIWFFLIGRRLFQLASRKPSPSPNTSENSAMTL